MLDCGIAEHDSSADFSTAASVVLGSACPRYGAAEAFHHLACFPARFERPDAASETMSESTAGLSLHALRQLLLAADYTKQAVDRGDVTQQVEQFIQSQLGDDVIEFKKPVHSLNDVIGFGKLKDFLATYLIPRMKLSDDRALPGAAIAGPIGGWEDLYLRGSRSRARYARVGSQEHS